MTRSTFSFAPLRQQDLAFLLEIRNECRESLHDNRPFSLRECENWYRLQSPDFRVITCDGERVGYFRLSNHDPEKASIYVGADLEARFRGQGLGKLVYEAFLPIVKAEYGISVVKLEVLSHNRVAIGLYKSLGFVETHRETRYTERNGAPVDNIFMSMSL